MFKKITGKQQHLISGRFILSHNLFSSIRFLTSINVLDGFENARRVRPAGPGMSAALA
jgi:hypothetical protein